MSPISSRNKRAPRRLLELARDSRRRAGEGAALVPEQFRLDQFARDRRHVERDERRAAARAQLVDRLRDQLLAGSRFARDQHGQVVRDDAGDHPIHFLHRRRAADQRGAAADVGFGEFGRLALPPRDRAAHRLRQHVEIERLGQIIERAHFGRAHRRRQRVLRREDDDRQLGMLARQPCRDIEPVAVGQHHVGHQHVGHFRRQRAAQLGDARGSRHPVPLALERGGDHSADRGCRRRRSGPRRS
jgi:hypothetical protein